ncbi:MAG: N-acetylmuramoyl-L-alanine amidase [Gammaproteobacteria bacterium]|nr:N-acetylmuramoyl-L-alanine amidase [Gammaproteobacteria bacterium]
MRVLCILLLLTATAAHAATRVDGLRMWPSPERARLVFDISAPLEHRVFTLADPHRVVVDLSGASLARPLEQPAADDRSLKRIRSAVRKKGDLRIVLDLKHKMRPKTFMLQPSDNYGHRLVLDLYPSDGATAPAPTVKRVQQGRALRDVVIAIDAGHGGEDPGAIGPRGTREKDVVFEIARELERAIAAERGMRPVLTRTGDYFLSLRKRIERARQHQADFFISIHADAFRDRRVRGASVYALSQRGATSEAARWLAKRENASDLIGGVSLEDKDNLLASVLLDLSQTATIEASLGAGNYMLKGLGRLGKLHKTSVQQAGFVVLKSPDIPSLLVETGFISNPTEEERLMQHRHRSAIARALVDGLRRYFSEHPPPGTILAARRHIITRGETLSEVAQHYKVSVDLLRATNELKSDRIQVGQELRIPASNEG